MKTINILLVLLGFNFCHFLVDSCSAQNKSIFSLNCDSLISLYEKYSIRSILPDSISAFYMRPPIEGQFVRYILIADSMLHEEPTRDIIGSLVVYETKYCPKETLFVEFISNIFPTISVYNNQLKAGVSTDDLVGILGVSYKIIEGHYLYKDKKKRLISIFETKNGKIESFRIGIYNKKIFNSIGNELTLDLLLKHYP